MAKKEKDYPVGYCRPPVEHRFPKGQSGNPKGRRKKPSKSSDSLEAILEEFMEVRENYQPRRLRKEEAVYLTLINAAIKGDARARDHLLKEIEKRRKFANTSNTPTEKQQDIVRIYLPYNGRLTPEEEERWHKEGKFELRPEEYWISHDGGRIEAVRRSEDEDK